MLVIQTCRFAQLNARSVCGRGGCRLEASQRLCVNPDRVPRRLLSVPCAYRARRPPRLLYHGWIRQNAVEICRYLILRKAPRRKILSLGSGRGREQPRHIVAPIEFLYLFCSQRQCLMPFPGARRSKSAGTGTSAATSDTHAATRALGTPCGPASSLAR